MRVSSLSRRISRRRVLTGSLAALGWPALTGPAVAHGAKAPRRSILTQGFSSAGMAKVTIDAATTYGTIMNIEAPATAIRVAVANCAPDPYALAGVNFRTLSETGMAAGQWQKFSFPLPVSEAYGLIGFSVPGNTEAETGARNVPALVWSDWLTISTSGERPVIEFRSLVPAQTLFLTICGNSRSDPGVLPASESRLLRSYRCASNLLDRPEIIPPEGPLPRGLADSVAAPVHAFQYCTATPGVEVIIGGDSNFSSWFTFSQLAVASLSTPLLPIGFWNRSWGGQNSSTFWPMIDSAIDFCDPSIVLLEGWTANDGGPQRYARYLERLLESVKRVKAAGAIPIVIKGMPRAMNGSPIEPAWEAYDQALDRYLPDVTVFDVMPIAGDPDYPGNWKPEYTQGNGVHANVHGAVAIAQPFADLLSRFL